MKLFENKFSEQDLCSIIPVIKRGELGFGENVSLFENAFSNLSKKKYNTAVNSASAAAFIIFDYLKHKFGPCDVYTPSLGFTSPAWAAQHHGHNLFFVDVDEHLLFDSESYLKIRNKNKSPSSRTVIMPILYGGVSSIPNLKLKGDEIVVVDSAHCVTPTIESDFMFFSFHPYKPICSSDGGIISTDKKDAALFFNSYRNFGRVNKGNTYDITQEGFKFYMNNLNATLALQSLSNYKDSLSQRKSNFEKIKIRSASIDDELFCSNILPHDEYSSYYFATIISDENNRNKLKKLYPTQTHYPLLHKTKYFKSDEKLNYTEKVFDNIINIPLHQNSEDDVSSMWADSTYKVL